MERKHHFRKKPKRSESSFFYVNPDIHDELIDVKTLRANKKKWDAVKREFD
ncbi:hypothetical protein [Thermohalobacter berrensis]|uniref:hypothetical protein n=1 Tax=Thermohalobacter berrensis TaxID=99594 RepID=UPI001601DE20|nr:hypothetical protein [Thermohalobacter berrensis]